MRATLGLILFLVLVPISGIAKSWDRSGSRDPVQLMELGQKPTPDHGGSGVFGVAQAGTTFFGGTVWAPDSARWEALPDSVWTFDTGVGSALVGTSNVPGVDPNKDPTLHAIMEGWIGWDNSFSEVTYFRRLSSSDPRWGTDVCVGSVGGLEGNYSFWCGVFESEADQLCYASGQGYGNSWALCIGQTFAYTDSMVTISFDTVVETETGYDFVFVQVDTSGAGDVVEAVAYDGSVVGTQLLSMVPGKHLPLDGNRDIQIRFCFRSDGAWSDEDNLNPTVCGAFAVDNISISGGGISHFTDFETGADGWALLPAEPGAGGDWSNIVHLDDLPPLLDPCGCALRDSVLVFEDLELGGHGYWQDNLAGSPWIDLERFGQTGTPGKIVKTNLYANLPLLNYDFAQLNVMYYPMVCGNTGKLVNSPWLSSGFVYFFGGLPICTHEDEPQGTQIDFSGIIPPGAEEVRIALGVISYCRFFGNCWGVGNTTPWFDQVALGVFGDPRAPHLSTRSINVPQDSFPENGTISTLALGRLDSNIILGASSPEIGTSLGDTLVVYGGGVGADGDGAEVFVEFSVHPGVGIDAVALEQFFSRVTLVGDRDGASWYSARMDTAEINGLASSNTWMTAYHEEDPNFTGSDTDLDDRDRDPNYGKTRLANDIFPDDLFTPGTRVHLFFKTRYIGGSTWFTTPDTTGANYLEWECLPSSMEGNFPLSGTWNCVLYVNHANEEAVSVIEQSLASVLGLGGANYEGTNWDRWDVQAPSSHQASWGRPLNTEYGANVLQALSYTCIIWSTGNLTGYNLVKEDADILIPWLTLADFDDNQLYLTGDGIAHSITNEMASEPSALDLLNDLAGVTLNCSTFRDQDCPPGSPEDGRACVYIDPILGSPVAKPQERTAFHMGQGNGCPERRSFGLLTVSTPIFGSAHGDEEYNAAKGAQFASIASDAGGDQLNYRIVTEGISVHHRRDESISCDFQSSDRTAVTERLAEVLNYLGHGSATSLCSDRIPGISEFTAPRKQFQTALSNFAPNPLLAGKSGKISFTLAREGLASVDVFDVNGRLVRNLFDGVAREGANDISWNGADETGRSVASGVYFYRLKTDSQEFSKKMVVVRQGGR